MAMPQAVYLRNTYGDLRFQEGIQRQCIDIHRYIDPCVSPPESVGRALSKTLYVYHKA